MEANGKTGTFIQCCNHYFGRKPDQQLREFMQECKALTPADKQEISEGLAREGYSIHNPNAGTISAG